MGPLPTPLRVDSLRLAGPLSLRLRTAPVVSSAPGVSSGLWPVQCHLFGHCSRSLGVSNASTLPPQGLLALEVVAICRLWCGSQQAILLSSPLQWPLDLVLLHARASAPDVPQACMALAGCSCWANNGMGASGSFPCCHAHSMARAAKAPSCAAFSSSMVSPVIPKELAGLLCFLRT